MYKILVTTTHFRCGTGVAVQTLVIDFDTEADANLAVKKINGDMNHKKVDSQYALALY